jgi:hypothetical protein
MLGKPWRALLILGRFLCRSVLLRLWGVLGMIQAAKLSVLFVAPLAKASFKAR